MSAKFEATTTISMSQPQMLWLNKEAERRQCSIAAIVRYLIDTARRGEDQK